MPYKARVFDDVTVFMPANLFELSGFMKVTKPMIDYLEI